MSQTLVSKILQSQGYTEKQNSLIGATFGLFATVPTKVIQDDVLTRVTITSNEVVFPLLAFVTTLSIDLQEELLDTGVDEDSLDKSALFVMDDDTLLIGDAETVVLLPLVVELNEDFSDLPRGTLLFSVEEDFDEQSETISAYSQSGRHYKLPVNLFEVVNFEDDSPKVLN